MNESIVGKYAGLSAAYQDSTAFKWTPDKNIVNHFGAKLVEYGFNYYGAEPLYSGMTGVEMHADIYIGLVYYQRLRHMISDKYQVRSLGPIDQLTRQPVKGRKRGGGIRFGEMERDSLIAHGATYLLQDRLFHGSDKSKTSICKDCGSFLSPRIEASGSLSDRDFTRPVCVLCGSADSVQDYEVPFIFLHLIRELISINIKVKLGNSVQ